MYNSSSWLSPNRPRVSRAIAAQVIRTDDDSRTGPDPARGQLADAQVPQRG
jgi:hypothetical protein